VTYQPVTAGGEALGRAQEDLSVALIQGGNAAQKGYPVWIRDRRKHTTVRLRAKRDELDGDVWKYLVVPPSASEPKLEERRILFGSCMALLANRGGAAPRPGDVMDTFTKSLKQTFNFADVDEPDLDFQVTVTAPTAAVFLTAVRVAKGYFDEPRRLGEGTTHMEARWDCGLQIRVRLEEIQEMREEQTLTDIVNKRLQGDAP
jgi:hypothetical protein